MLDFSEITSPLEPSEFIRELYPKLFSELAREPSPEHEALRSEIARHFPLFSENVMVADGHTHLLSVVIRALAPRRALLVEPCSPEYRRLLNLQKAEIWSTPLRESDGFRFRTSEIFNSLQRVQLLILGHPNNPTGTALAREDLLEILKQARRRNIFVVVDESFVDWHPELSVAREVKDSSYFLVLRSFSSFYGLAGMPVAYALGARRLIQKIQSYRESCALNRLAEKLATAALQDTSFREEARQWLREEGASFQKGLESLGCFKVFSSLTPFFLLKLRSPFKGASFFTSLKEQGVLLKSLQGFAGLEEAYFRISIRSEKENAQLLEKVPRVLESAASHPSVSPSLRP